MSGAGHAATSIKQNGAHGDDTMCNFCGFLHHSLVLDFLSHDLSGIMFNEGNHPQMPLFQSEIEFGWWFGTFLTFPYIGNFIIPTDEVIFFRGVGGFATSDHLPRIAACQHSLKGADSCS